MPYKEYTFKEIASLMQAKLSKTAQRQLSQLSKLKELTDLIITEKNPTTTMNSIFSITVEKNNSVWAFTDKSRDLLNEPFVSGADLILDKLCIKINAPFMKLNLIFANFPFPDHMFSFSKKSYESGGWWYNSVDFSIDGWLCPAMFKYFEEAPDNIYLKVLPVI